MQDYSGEPPHPLELFVGHKLLSEDGVGDDNRTVRDVENGDAVVQEKCVPDNSQGNADASKLVDGIEVSVAAFEALAAVAGLQGRVKRAGKRARNGTRAGKNGYFALLGTEPQFSQGRHGGGGTTGVASALKANAVGVDLRLKSR